jgi:hypothetical protein
MNVKRLLVPVLALAVCAGVVAAYQQPTPPARGVGGGYAVTTVPGVAGGANWSQAFFGQSKAYGLVQKYVKAEKEEDRRDLRRQILDALTEEFEQHAERQEKSARRPSRPSWSGAWSN